MASTIPPIAAFDYSKRGIKNMPLDQIEVRLLDDINKQFWMAGNWRWTIGTLAAIPLVSITADYTLAVPTDFLYLVAAYISDGAGVTRYLGIMPTLPANGTVSGIPDFISYQGSNIFRVSPIPGTLPSPTKELICYYKKKAPTITARNAFTAGTLVFDDEYFPVYSAGVLAAAYAYGDDQRSGTVTVDGRGTVAYTGQRALFMAGIARMAQIEPTPYFDSRTTKDEKTI